MENPIYCGVSRSDYNKAIRSLVGATPPYKNRGETYALLTPCHSQSLNGTGRSPARRVERVFEVLASGF